MTVLQVCAYGAEYAGNFIPSLEVLENKLKEQGIGTVYAFVERARDKEWCKKIEERTKVYYLPEAKARILPETYSAFRKIYKENDISVVHSHFELYDIPATVTAPKAAKVFWHLHDPLTQNGQSTSRRILTKIQYGIVGKKANLISVADEYRKKVVSLGFPEEQTCTVVNGINTSRIRFKNAETAEHKYDFMTFGWDFYRKGDDLILAACDKLAGEGYKFSLLLNGNASTWEKLDEYYGGKELPEYLVKGNPVDDVNLLFNCSDVFIQASRRETFSYAVCEAAYAGMPVISTDIAGLEWAHDIPTVRFTEPESADSLCTAMKEFLDGKMVSPETVSEARKVIENKYTTECWARNVAAKYNVLQDTAEK